MTAVSWGATTTRGRVRGFDCLVFSERPAGLDQLLDGVARWGDREYLIEGNRRITFDDLLCLVDAVASELGRQGVGPGERVLFLARNSIEWVVAFWAVHRLRGVAVLGNAWWGEHDVRRAVSLVSPRVVFTDSARLALLGESTKTVSADDIREVISHATATDTQGTAKSDEQRNEDDAAVILFTSGTTGPAKGAILSHRSIIANQQGFLAMTKRLPDDLPDDHRATTSLLSTPLFHTGGLQAITTALLTGGRLVFTTGKFDPAAVIGLLESERVTVWAGVPTMIQRVLEHPNARTADLSSVRAIGLGGAPLPAHVLAQIPDVFPRASKGMSTNYGSTEAGGIITTAAGPVVLQRPGTSGRPLPHVEVALGLQDEILVRSSALMSGYWGETDSPIDADGWLHSGDVGRIDEDGYVYVIDRIKDIIIRGGENIAASHVEMALMSHPGVSGVAVIGLPHPDLGEQVGAVVVLRSGHDVTVEELQQHVRGLPHFEVPSQWWLRNEPLPENATGKTDKRALKAAFPLPVV